MGGGDAVYRVNGSWDHMKERNPQPAVCASIWSYTSRRPPLLLEERGATLRDLFDGDYVRDKENELDRAIEPYVCSLLLSCTGLIPSLLFVLGPPSRCRARRAPLLDRDRSHSLENRKSVGGPSKGPSHHHRITTPAALTSCFGFSLPFNDPPSFDHLSML